MKRVLKITSIIFLTLLLCAIAGFGIYLACVPRVALDKALLDSTSQVTRYYDINGAEITALHSGINATYVPISELSEQTRYAFLCTEDKRFYKHKGYDLKRMIAAGLKNITSGETEQGGSTITQQLAKNTHLTQKKTLSRKIQEIRLAKEIESAYSKDEILEKYLNIIYFGHNIYGIESAARYYFNTHAANLTLPQAATLAAIINAPTRNSPLAHPEAALSRRNLVLKNMFNQGKIDQQTFTDAISSPLTVNPSDSTADYYLSAARLEANNLNVLNLNLAGCSIYTNYSPTEQKKVYDAMKNCEFRSKAVLSNLDGKILASYSKDFSTINLKRQPGSLLKPVAVYAPAIERGMLTAATPILDEETDFGGYRPKNFGGGHNGWLSARQALASSNNIAAVKTFQMSGLDYNYDFAKKLGIPLVNEDKALTLALGGMKYGATAESLVGAYAALAASGQYLPAQYVEKIVSPEGKNLYARQDFVRAVMSSDTAHIVTDMMRTCALEGTASKLGALPFQIAAKTGTVGYLDTEMNTDAYSASFTSQHALVVWYGSDGREKDSALGSEIRGGTFPTATAKEIYSSLYNNGFPSDFSYRLQELSLDRTAYESDHKLIQAPYFLSPKDTVTEKFGMRVRPEAARLVTPTLQVELQNNMVMLTVTGDRYADYQIIRYDLNGSVTIPVGKLSSANSGQIVYDSARPHEFSVYQLVALYPDGNCSISDNIRIFTE